MGTHSLIAKQIDTDTYRTVFCQMNGHLEFQGAMLLEKFSTPEQVDRILDLGDLYLLYPILEPDSALPHTLDSPQKNVTVAFQREFGYEDMAARNYTLEELGGYDELIEFVYIMNQKGEWKYFQGGYLEEGLRDVKEDLDLLEKGIDVIKPPPIDFVGEWFQEEDMDDDPQEDMSFGL